MAKRYQCLNLTSRNVHSSQSRGLTTLGIPDEKRGEMGQRKCKKCVKKMGQKLFNKRSPPQATGYSKEVLFFLSHHGFSNSSLCSATPQQATGNRVELNHKTSPNPDGLVGAFLLTCLRLVHRRTGSRNSPGGGYRIRFEKGAGRE